MHSFNAFFFWVSGNNTNKCMFVRIYVRVRCDITWHFPETGAPGWYILRGWFGNCSCSTASHFSSADLKFKMTWGREEGSGQTNLPWLSWAGQSDIGVDREGEDRGQTSQDKGGSRGGSQRCRVGKNSNKSLPHLFCLDMFTSRWSLILQQRQLGILGR